MFHSKSIFVSPLVVLILILLSSSCQRQQTPYKTDIENLYAVKLTPAEKEHLLKKYEGDVQKITDLSHTQEHQIYIDSIINELRCAGSKEALFPLIAIAQKDAKKQKDYNRLATTYEAIAVYYHDAEKLDSVYYYYLKAASLYSKSGDSLALAENNYYQARTLFEVGYNKVSEVKLYQALKTLRNYPENPIHIEANQIRAFYLLSHESPENIQKSLDILLDTYQLLKGNEGKYKILPEDKHNLAMANLLNNIAMTYQDLQQYDLAEKYVVQAIAYYEKNPSAISLYAHLNSTYYLALYYQKPSIDIIKHLKESLDIYIGLDSHYYTIDMIKTIAGLYYEMNQPEQAVIWLKKAFDYTDANKLYNQKKEIIELLLVHHPEEQTPALINELITINHLLEYTQKETRDSFANIEYNTFLLEKENTILKQQIGIVYIAAFILISGLTFLLIYIRLRNKNKDLAHSNSEKSKNEQIMSLLIENNTIENVTILKERNRIAKDLHDGVINSIFTLRFNTQLLEIPNEKLKKMLVDELILLENKVRDISHSFAQQNLFQNKSFEKLLIELVSKQTNKDKTQFSITFEPNLCLEHLTTVQKVNIYQIIQEAFQNVNKHAGASLCKLEVTIENHNIVFRVQDNGKGMKRTSFRGIGLTNMRERAQLIEAELRILSNPQTGTEISLELN